ncbi:heme peroxidase [Paracoccus sediminis]|uniref:Animal haem peroxidase n=1 Tax=Paracoccus sediminis TaxID=1214787 RepID=A0A238WPI2_9RHOB|nr:heme peroxidase family protein [Paracoccus sediminis]TBN50414.1 heme peroxidase [Paracoccus sediminis]SNR48435.1 Animal haem peroxidase [Paracoccus sediminis]
MTILVQSHGGPVEPPRATPIAGGLEAGQPADGDVAPDERADFGYLFPPSGNADDYLPDTALDDLDELARRMVPDTEPENTESTLPAVMTYWGQFLDHELTARTDRDAALSDIATGHPLIAAEDIERLLKNARTPRFDLDSVYGGLPVGPGMTPEQAANAAAVIAGMRHPTLRAKMRVGTCLTGGDNEPMPDSLDAHRDLPRFAQVEDRVRQAYLDIARGQLSPADFAAFEASLPQRAIIGDKRNEENLVIAQFHLSFLRFHNRAVDFLNDRDTGWVAEFSSARDLVRLHYQWLTLQVYLRAVCDPAVVDRILDDRARAFFAFRDDYYARNPKRTLGNVLPLEFSAAAYRFGHTMVRGIYDYNPNFGRPGAILPESPFNLLFGFTAGGGFRPFPAAPAKAKLPANWIIDWPRFLTVKTDFDDGLSQHAARSIDTVLAPPLGDMVNEGGDAATPDLKALFRHLARRNLRRGLSLRLPTGQALHRHLKAQGAVTSDPIRDISTALRDKPDLGDFLRGSGSALHCRTPLWFYILAEAEAGGGNRLGELGSWIVASSFIGVMLSDPDSALSRGFEPAQSPLRMPDGSPVDTLEKWMRFALVMA